MGKLTDKQRKDITFDDVLNIILGIDLTETDALSPGMFQLCQDAMAELTKRPLFSHVHQVPDMSAATAARRDRTIHGRFVPSTPKELMLQ